MRIAIALGALLAFTTLASIGLARDIPGPKEPEPTYYQFPFDEKTGEFIGDPDDLYCEEDDWENDLISDSWEDETRGTCWGICHYHGSPEYEIHCVINYKNLYTIVGLAYGEDDIVLACKYNGSTWVQVGYCDRESVDELLVDGNSVNNDIWFVKAAGDWSNECRFKAYDGVFEAGHLEMWGKGGCDRIGGSNYADAWLQAEYVDGDEGDDYIQLEADSLACVGGNPQAHGKEGSDTIDGSSEDDMIWADTITDSTNYGDDVVDCGDGDDQALGAYGNDRIWGGVGLLGGGGGEDALWGGPGSDDLYGEYDNDVLYGGLDSGDTCDGGGGSWDLCGTDCEDRPNCEGWPP